MMQRLVVGVALSGIFAVGFQALAVPLNMKQVSDDARWVGHVDFDAMRDSVVVKKAIKKHMARHKNAEAHLKMAQAMIGIDPRQDLHGATFYGKQVGKHTGVMILHARLDRAKVQGWAEKIPGREASEYGSHKISSWTIRRGEHSHALASAWFGDEHLVLASSVDELKAALDVLDGKAGSIGSDNPLAGRVPDGTTLLLRVTGIATAELPCKNPAARQTESVRLVLGEHQGESFFRARATMTNTEVVGQVHEIVKGGQALARLCSGDNDLKLRLVNGLRVKPDGNDLTLLWKGSAEDVWQHLEAESKKWEAKLAKMCEHRRKHGDHGEKCSKCSKCAKCVGKGEPCEDCKKKDDKRESPENESPAEEDAI